VGYATCSPLLPETDAVVASVVHERMDVEVVSTHRWWPHLHGTDAMYLAIVRKH
jgi:16S rRNA (cytosine967-C5)-methyltransferase